MIIRLEVLIMKHVLRITLKTFRMHQHNFNLHRKMIVLFMTKISLLFVCIGPSPIFML